MKATELKDKSVEELNVTLNELLQDQFKLRMEKATGQVTETHKLREVRRDIARVKTIINQKAGS
ncbi:50S ribosomal protein L29 [Kangiella sp. HD9-110m-PIT-SAG06]|uniref:Large ribosomal subunit protein uL29 n=4 Tax=Kangiella TaxID=261963 RepID=A0A0F6TRQ6_9GAMM|nr:MULTISPECIES: 50S ribosomal protein L29 [Kangiella]AKE52854.1 50S ribosomal protein L29 [Kangiella geojedonensis]AOE50686.1 50S ribosomal protein L29 [Kangiella sediminilitoris]RDX35233.1 50S ribosomal protein L29 [Kangiella sp. HD9-110m-PIT-SAG06]RDX36865.1 50S ribosomal protein L29 [Kangiella sp. HD9-110m-PIT-SAG07]